MHRALLAGVVFRDFFYSAERRLVRGFIFLRYFAVRAAGDVFDNNFHRPFDIKARGTRALQYSSGDVAGDCRQRHDYRVAYSAKREFVKMVEHNRDYHCRKFNRYRRWRLSEKIKK